MRRFWRIGQGNNLGISLARCALQGRRGTLGKRRQDATEEGGNGLGRDGVRCPDQDNDWSDPAGHRGGCQGLTRAVLRQVLARKLHRIKGES